MNTYIIKPVRLLISLFSQEPKKGGDACCANPFPQVKCAKEGTYEECMACKRKWRTVVTQHLQSCPHCSHGISPYLTINLLKDGKTGWTKCCECGAYIHKDQFKPPQSEVQFIS